MFFRDNFGFLAGLYDFRLAEGYFAKKKLYLQNNLLQIILWLGNALAVAVSCDKAV